MFYINQPNRIMLIWKYLSSVEKCYEFKTKESQAKAGPTKKQNTHFHI